MDPTYSRDESRSQRLDRNYGELLQELRVAQAGVQILFAFLLVLPFQQRFAALSGGQRALYLVTLVSAALSVIVFTAPVAMHRIVFREGVKDFAVAYTGTVVAAGLTTLAVTVLGGTVLVLDVLVSHVGAVVIGVVLAAVMVTLWVVVPVRRRRRTPAGKIPDPER